MLAFITDMKQQRMSCKKQLKEELDKKKAELFRDAAMVSMRESKITTIMIFIFKSAGC